MSYIIRFGTLILILVLTVSASMAYAANEKGYLWVKSRPRDLFIYMDGYYTSNTNGFTTPFSKSNLIEKEPGKYRFEIYDPKQNFETYREWITIEPGKILELNVVLARQGFKEAPKVEVRRYVKAYITIDSVPSDANVYLDGGNIGKTPIDYAIQERSKKDIELRIVKIGYEPYTETIRWTDLEDGIHEVKGELEEEKSQEDSDESQGRKKFVISTQVIVLFAALVVMIGILAVRLIIRSRKRDHSD